MKLKDCLLKACQLQATDILLSGEEKPWYKINMEWRSFAEDFFIKEFQLKHVLCEYLQVDQLVQGDYAFTFFDRRYRLHVFEKNTGFTACIRLLPRKILSTKEIELPLALFEQCEKRQGLILITGATGQGKTTTLASLVQAINGNYKRHIITLEDPIEYVFKNDKSYISQRQYGEHFKSFAEGLKQSLRQAPNVIMLGEVRDVDSMRMLLMAAETGHLVLASLHTASVETTMSRILNFFPVQQQQYLCDVLADVLLAVCSQRLYAKKEGGLLASYELLINNNASKNIIREKRFHELNTIMQTGKRSGMMTFAQDATRIKQNAGHHNAD